MATKRNRHGVQVMGWMVSEDTRDSKRGLTEAIAWAVPGARRKLDCRLPWGIAA